MTKIKPWIEKSRTQVYKKYSRKIEEVIFELPDGTTSDFYIKAEGPAVCVLALTKDNEIILVNQFRPGPNKIMSELPGGYVDKGETPIDAIARELKEETGFVGQFELVTTAFDDAYSTMVRYCYVAKDCQKVNEPQQSSTEQTELMLINLADFKLLLRSGEMTDIEVGFLGLDYLKL